MKLYKASHTVFSLKYHIVWITKKRVKKFYRLVAEKAKDILVEVGEENDFEIEEVSVEREHVHLYIGFGPEIAVSTVVGILKAKTSSLFQQEYPYLTDDRKRV